MDEIDELSVDAMIHFLLENIRREKALSRFYGVDLHDAYLWGDYNQHRSFDIEVYAPGCDQWLEVSSVSWFSDYQARRAAIRFRRPGAKGTELVHTLNGSGLAVGRTMVATLTGKL